MLLHDTQVLVYQLLSWFWVSAVSLRYRGKRHLLRHVRPIVDPQHLFVLIQRYYTNLNITVKTNLMIHLLFLPVKPIFGQHLMIFAHPSTAQPISQVLQLFSSVILAVHSNILFVSFSGAGPPFSQLYLWKKKAEKRKRIVTLDSLVHLMINHFKIF